MTQLGNVLLLDDGRVYKEAKEYSDGKIKVKGLYAKKEIVICQLLTGRVPTTVAFKDADPSNMALDNLDFIFEEDINFDDVKFWDRIVAYKDGRIVKKFNVKGHPAGEPIGGKAAKGYRSVTVKVGNTIGRKLEHVLVYALHHGAFPESPIDHIDGNKQNNSIENLREVSYSQNGHNRKTKADGLPTGVKKTKTGKYAAQITVDYYTTHLGTYDTIEEAAEARRKAEATSTR